MISSVLNPSAVKSPPATAAADRTSSAATAVGREQNCIGLLRLVLAAAVAYSHAWYLSARDGEPLGRFLFGEGDNPGSFAVKGFFFLSGFLLMESQRRTVSVRRFLWNRMLRIYPALWLCLLVTAFIVPLIAFRHAPPPPGLWPSAANYVWHNLVLVRSQIGIEGLVFPVAGIGDLNGSLWSLPYELGCYAMLAFFSWLGVTGRKSRWPYLIGSAFLALYVRDTLSPDHPIFFFGVGRKTCAWFVVGALFALLPAGVQRTRLRWLWSLAAFTVYCIACHTGRAELVGPLAISAGFFWLIGAFPLGGFERRVRGDYSFGLYLYSYPAAHVVVLLGWHRHGIAFTVLATIALGLLLAVMSWHLLEKRVLALKTRPAIPAGAV